VFSPVLRWSLEKESVWVGLVCMSRGDLMDVDTTAPKDVCFDCVTLYDRVLEAVILDMVILRVMVIQTVG